MNKVEVVTHDLRWKDAFITEAAAITHAMGANVHAIHHMGSTSIPGIHAKPVIDLLVEVRDLSSVDNRNTAMRALGYECMGEFGMPGRRYFRKDAQNGVRTHQIHTFEIGSDQMARHLAFRDYMIAHPDEAQAYSDLKRQLANAHPYDMEAYMDGKDGFIKEIDRRAAVWAAAS